MAKLATRAQARLRHAFRPATQRAYLRMFKEFLGFLVAAELQLRQVNHVVFLAFMQYLVLNQISPANISNYLSGVRAQCIVFNLDSTYFQHQQIQYFMRSLKINGPLQPKIHKHIDIQLLTNIIRITETLQHPNIFTTSQAFKYSSTYSDLLAIWQRAISLWLKTKS